MTFHFSDKNDYLKRLFFLQKSFVIVFFYRCYPFLFCIERLIAYLTEFGTFCKVPAFQALNVYHLSIILKISMPTKYAMMSKKSAVYRVKNNGKTSSNNRLKYTQTTNK